MPHLGAKLFRIVERCVTEANQVGAIDSAHDVVFLGDVSGDQGLGQHQSVAAALAFQFDDAVIGAFVHREAGVAGQGPWGGGPGQQEHVGVASTQLLQDA